MQLGETPLHRAAWNGQLELVQLLLRHGADKELKNWEFGGHYGRKPVDIVCNRGNNKQHKAAITALLR